MPAIHCRLPNLLPLWLFGLLIFSTSLLAQPAPLAMVTDVQGSPSLKGQPLALMTELEENDLVELPEGSQITLVYYEAGEEYNLKGPLSLSIKREAPEVDGKPLSGTALLPRDAGTRLLVADYSPASYSMRSSSPSPQPLRLLQPAWSIVLKPSPLFVWELANGNDSGFSYRLKVRNDQNQVFFSGQSDTRQVRLPEGLLLPRGERLTWELEARRGHEVFVGSAQFLIADEATAAKVEEITRALGQDFKRRLVLLRFLRVNKFQQAADELWQRLVSERPELGRQASP